MSRKSRGSTTENILKALTDVQVPLVWRCVDVTWTDINPAWMPVILGYTCWGDIKNRYIQYILT